MQTDNIKDKTMNVDKAKAIANSILILLNGLTIHDAKWILAEVEDSLNTKCIVTCLS